MKNIKPTLVLSCICMAVALILSGINMVTGPIIEAQRAAAANGALVEVMPEGSSFEEIDISSLSLPESITNAYKETSGKGYVFRVLSTGYKSGMVIMVGVNAEGKITGSKCLETQDTFGKEPQLDNSYNNQSLGDFAPNIISGATMTSNGYRDAISIALQSFTLASGGKLDPVIVLEAKVAELAPGFANLTAVDASGSFNKILKASNDTGFAYISSDGENGYLALVNASGTCIVYDAEANDVTEVQASLAEEAKAHASANQTDYAEKLTAKLATLEEGTTDISRLSFSSFGNVVAAVEFKVNGETQYAFYSRPVTYESNPIDMYTIIDANGAIVKQDITQILFGHGVEYMPVYSADMYGDPSSENYVKYENSFGGLNADTLDNVYMISGATISSTAIKTATADVFNIFSTIKGDN